MRVGLKFLVFVFLKHVIVCKIEMYIADAWFQGLLEKGIYVSLSWYPLYLCLYLFELEYYRVRFKVIFSYMQSVVQKQFQNDVYMSCIYEKKWGSAI